MEKKDIAATNDIIDINLDATRKKRFRIDGDNERILELDTSDLTIITRIEESYKRLDALASKASAVQLGVQTEAEDETNLEIKSASELLTTIDKEMRDIVDYIFDSDVSAKCAPSGSLFDAFNGQFRYEHIIDAMFKLYDENLTKEYNAMKKRIQKHTKKYTR